MEATSTPLIGIEFSPDGFSLDMAYLTIGAMVDMALSAAGATIADLDLCDTALRELLEVLSSTGPLHSASLDPEHGVLVIISAQAAGSIPKDSSELIALGFDEIVVESNQVRCTFAHRLRS